MQIENIKKEERSRIRVEIQHGKLVERTTPEKRSDPEAYKREVRTSLSLASGLGFSIVLPLIGGIFLGKLIDRYMNTDGRYTVIFLFVGCALGIANILMMLKKD